MTDSALVYGHCQAKAGSPSTVERLKKTASTIGLVGAGVALCVAAAHAGTDTTFDSIATQITDWTDGSLGRVATVAAGAVMIFNIVTGFKWQVVASAVATGLAVNFGPSVISGMTTATF